MEWVIICNPHDYLIEKLMRVNFEGSDEGNKFMEINWKQRNEFEVGDVLYMYVTKPLCSIMCKCVVTEVNHEAENIDDSEYVVDSSNWRNSEKFMTIRFTDYYGYAPVLELHELQKNGLKKYQGASRVTESLSKYFSDVIPNYIVTQNLN